ncbi:MAG: nuclear transport factor 2 family protein [Pseudomonadota bacterium]
MSESTDRQILNKANLGIVDGLPLQASDGGLDELRKNIQHLMDIEAIKQLKHAYFRCIDTANLDELGTLFHPEVKVHFIGGTYEWQLTGSEEYVASIGQSFNKRSVGHHNGHQPEIQVLSDTEATGIWYLTDNMWVMKYNSLTSGTAIYWDRYVKQNGRWLISDTRYERLYELNEPLQGEPAFSSHYLGVHGSDA